MFFHPDGIAITPNNFSSTGGKLLAKPDFTAADGVSCATTGFANFFGTSAAAPHAAAIAALMLEKNPVLTRSEVMEALKKSTWDIHSSGWDRNSGYGIINAYKAVQNTPLPPAPSAPTGVGASDREYSDKIVVEWQRAYAAVSYNVYRNTTNVKPSTPINAIPIVGTSYEDTTAEAEITYYYWITAVNSTSESTSSGSVTGRRRDLIVPPAPTNVGATKETSDTQITITWDPTQDATSYIVYRGTSQYGYEKEWNVGNVTSFPDTTAVEGVSYYYRVVAINAKGNSPFSELSTVGKLRTPQGVYKFTATETSKSKTFGRSGAVHIVQIPNGGTITWPSWITSIRYNSTEIGQNKTFQNFGMGAYTISVGVTANTSSQKRSHTLSTPIQDANLGNLNLVATIEQDGAVSKPSSPGISASNGDYPDKIVISWTKINSAAYYQVYRGVNSSSSAATLIADNVTTMTFTDISASSGTTYYYWVKAVNSAGESAFSSSNTGYRKPSQPTTTTMNVAIPASGGTVNSGNIDNTAGETYRLSISGCPSWITSVALVDNRNNIMTIGTGTTSLTWSGIGYLKITAQANTTGSSRSWTMVIPYGANNTLNVVITQSAGSSSNIDLCPYQPSGWDGCMVVSTVQNATSSSTSFTSQDTVYAQFAIANFGQNDSAAFNFSLYIDDVCYQTARCDEGVHTMAYSSWTAIINPLSAGTHTLRLVVDSDYEIAETDETNNAYTKTFTVVSAITVPSVPTNVTASDGAYTDKVVISWSSVNGATSYTVYRGTGSSSSSASVLASSVTGTSYNDTSAVAGTTYYYWVKAVNSAGASGFSTSNTGYKAVPVTHPDMTVGGIHWTGSGDAAWTITNSGEGQFAATSGDIDANQSSSLKATVSGKGTLSFKWMVSSEANYDKLTVYTNGVVHSNISGTDGGWVTVSILMSTTGSHIFEWKYSKDGSVDNGSDCGWIKEVKWTALNGDSWDPTDDTRANGTSISPTTSTQTHGPHTLSSTDTEDWFRVTMVAGRTYTFESTDLAGDSYGELYDSMTDDTGIAYDDDGAGNRNFRIVYTSTTAKTCYLCVRAYSPGNDVSYKLRYYYEEKVTTGGVPHTWIDQYKNDSAFAFAVAAAGGDYEKLAQIEGLSGYTFEECYIIGIKPTEKGRKFISKIEIVDGVPVITPDPNLGADRTYVTEGVSELGGKWTEIKSDADKVGKRFFRVKVALPR